MTRKCALCKGTNYKRTYSFFSAPKDPEIRKKWQDVIPIANYVVTDDTYICSKHFRASDIVTHWVSGVPPNVVRIKYKKCRLRNGAIPSLNFEGSNNQVETPLLEESDPHDELIADQISYLIPRKKDVDHDFQDSDKSIEPIITFARYNVEDERNTYSNKSERISNDSSAYMLAKDDTHESVDSTAENGECIRLDNHFVYKLRQKRKGDDHPSIISDNVEKRLDNCNDELANPKNVSSMYSEEKFGNVEPDVDQDVEIFGEELETEEIDPLHGVQLHTENNRNGEVEDLENSQRLRRNIDKKKYDERSPESALCDTMLFEDLLEIYTEVTLPRGWTFLVTSKGHATTVVYLSMSMPTNHVPIVEKEVYVKSDMVMHCGVGNREINPFHHDLLKDGRDVHVHALSDIEELVDELDQRHVCEGGPSVKNIDEYGETRVAYVDGGKWRHAKCPLIINNGASKCSKCLSLNGLLKRKTSVANHMSSEMYLEVEKLMSSLKKLTRRNQRLEEMRQGFQTKVKLLLTNSDKRIRNAITVSKMPEIQKLMVKECLKTSAVDNKKHVRYSETWIFLCVLLYVESPRMYKYMSVNNYMALPSMVTIRKYLIQIKSNPQFYSLFQKSVEPYQPGNKRDEEEPT